MEISVINLDIDEARRFKNSYWVDKSTKCWRWTAITRSSNPKVPYGGFKLRGIKYDAHRLSYMVANGVPKLSKTDWIQHTCENKDCVNPAHLKLSSRSKAMEDGYKKGTVTPPTWGETMWHNKKNREKAVANLSLRNTKRKRNEKRIDD